MAIMITSFSGSVQNWRMGYVDFMNVMYLGIPALIAAQVGVYVTTRIPSYWLLGLFGVMLLCNIYLAQLKKNLCSQSGPSQRLGLNSATQVDHWMLRLATGGLGGLLSGMFGVGGGVVMVPMQMLLLGENIKTAIQTSLGVIVVTALSATVGHAAHGNVQYLGGLLLGVGGMLGAQVSTRILPKLDDSLVSVIFRVFLSMLSFYFFWRAWVVYQSVFETKP
jgi:uncharacterized membrane protein YfcA